MKICIVTVYNTENCGSFLQAYALKEALEHAGHKVTFLERNLKGTANSVSRHLTQSLKYLARGKFWQAGAEWLRFHNFRKAGRVFDVTENRRESWEDIDCLVIGSDTIWNFDSPYFFQKRTRYLGLDFAGKKRIAYGASIGNTKYSTMRERPEIAKGIKGLAQISVRDEYSKQIADELGETDAPIVADPTLLIPCEVYRSVESRQQEEDYILLYYFGKIPERVKNQILTFAGREKKKIISFGEYRGWCSKSIVYDPAAFLAYFRRADFIVTNTYHGTIFSVLYQKRFADYGGEKKKVADLLSQFDLEQHLCGEETDLGEILHLMPDAARVKEKIEEFRKVSNEYLRNAIGE